MRAQKTGLIALSPDFAIRLGMKLQLTSPSIAFKYLKKKFSQDVEEFWVVALATDKSVLNSRCLFRGTVDHCLFHPRDVFRFVILQNASAFLVAHNHPSGNLEPSQEDLRATQQLLTLALIVEIAFVDHLIISPRRYFSFLESGMLNLATKDPAWTFDP